MNKIIYIRFIVIFLASATLLCCNRGGGGEEGASVDSTLFNSTSALSEEHWERFVKLRSMDEAGTFDETRFSFDLVFSNPRMNVFAVTEKRGHYVVFVGIQGQTSLMADYFDEALRDMRSCFGDFYALQGKIDTIAILDGDDHPDFVVVEESLNKDYFESKTTVLFNTGNNLLTQHPPLQGFSMANTGECEGFLGFVENIILQKSALPQETFQNLPISPARLTINRRHGFVHTSMGNCDNYLLTNIQYHFEFNTEVKEFSYHSTAVPASEGMGLLTEHLHKYFLLKPADNHQGYIMANTCLDRPNFTFQLNEGMIELVQSSGYDAAVSYVCKVLPPAQGAYIIVHSSDLSPLPIAELAPTYSIDTFKVVSATQGIIYFKGNYYVDESMSSVFESEDIACAEHE